MCSRSFNKNVSHVGTFQPVFLLNLNNNSQKKSKCRDIFSFFLVQNIQKEFVEIPHIWGSVRYVTPRITLSSASNYAICVAWREITYYLPLSSSWWTDTVEILARSSNQANKRRIVAVPGMWRPSSLHSEIWWSLAGYQRCTIWRASSRAFLVFCDEWKWEKTSMLKLQLYNTPSSVIPLCFCLTYPPISPTQTMAL